MKQENIIILNRWEWESYKSYIGVDRVLAFASSLSRTFFCVSLCDRILAWTKTRFIVKVLTVVHAGYGPQTIGVRKQQ